MGDTSTRRRARFAIVTGLIVGGLLAPTPGIGAALAMERSSASVPTPGSSSEPDAPTGEVEPTVEPSPPGEPQPTEESAPSTSPSPEPTLTTEPAPTTEPEPTVEPEPTAEPEPTTEPEPTAEPEPTTEPEPTAEPAPTEEPTRGVAPFASALTSTVVDGVTVERIGGPNRYAVAAGISFEAFPGGAPIAFIASGTAFPDALSAAPAAVAAGGPLLLTQPTLLSEPTKTELLRLAPKKVVILGGTGAVSSAVAKAIAALGLAVERVDGPDRYAVSRSIAARYFPEAKEVFIATGRDFPDALAAGGVAGARGAPVMLVDGSASSVGAAARSVLSGIAPESIIILGGTGAVSAAIESELRSIAAVKRIGGANRYVVAESVSATFISASERAFLAAGTNFPDSLAGAVLAGISGGPLYLVPPGCPTVGSMSDALDRLSVTTVTILGGPAAVSTDAEQLRGCSALSPAESAAQLTSKLTAQLASLPGKYTITVRELDGMKRTISIGSTTPREPASVIKLFAAYAILSRVDAGQLSLATPTRSGISIGSCLRVMIHISDNLCHADLLAVLGNDRINRIVWDAGFTRTYYVGTDGGGTYRSAKRTTTGDLTAMLARLESGTLLSEASTTLLLDLLDEQLWRSKIPSGIERGTAFGNKTGQLWVTTGLVEADAGIVRGPAGTYAIAILGSHNSANWAIARLSRTVSEHFIGRSITPASWGTTNLVAPRATTMYDRPGGTAIGTIPAGARLDADVSNRVLYRVLHAGKWVWVHHSAVETQY